MRHHAAAALFFIAATVVGCDQRKNTTAQTPMDTTSTGHTPSIKRAPWGTVEGHAVEKFTVTNGRGLTAEMITYGATVTRLLTPDRGGVPGDVVLGFDNLRGYLQKENPYFGCIAGRYANRIAGAKFELDGKTYKLAANNGVNALHGGLKGFDKVLWEATPLATNDGVRFTYDSPDGEEGYPGRLHAEVTISLTQDNALKFEYAATTDHATPVNLTHHGYFNLSAGKDSTILDHRLTLRASRYTPVDAVLIPTGDLSAVAASPMDFTSAHRVGERIGAVAGGYDHNWVLDYPGVGTEPQATLEDSGSGRRMDIFTSEPGIQFYSGNFLDGTLAGKGGRTYPRHAGLCLETQHFPDSPHQPSFPSTILRPGETYRQTTLYRFSAK